MDKVRNSKSALTLEQIGNDLSHLTGNPDELESVFKTKNTKLFEPDFSSVSSL